MVDVSSAVLEQVSERLGLYVYILVDPRDSRPFYVGKGRGVRMAAHGVEALEAEERTDRAKLARIRDIRAAGREHEIWIARYGMSGAEYTAVEAALIDTLASFPITPAPAESRYRPLELRGELTNARREDAAGKGMVLLERLVDELAAPELSTVVPLLLIALKPWGYLDEEIAGGRTRPGYGFKREWVEPTLRDRDAHLLEMATASWWVLSPDQIRRRRITHVVPLYHGATRPIGDEVEAVLLAVGEELPGPALSRDRPQASSRTRLTSSPTGPAVQTEVRHKRPHLRRRYLTEVDWPSLRTVTADLTGRWRVRERDVDWPASKSDRRRVASAARVRRRAARGHHDGRPDRGSRRPARPSRCCRGAVAAHIGCESFVLHSRCASDWRVRFEARLLTGGDLPRIRYGGVRRGCRR